MSEYAKDYSLPELMAASVAREINDGELCFIGVGMPLMAATVAKFTHAPNFNMMVEYGAVGPSPRRLPMCVNCAVNCERAYFTGNQREVMGAQQNGYVDAGCISGAQIDKFGNLNLGSPNSLWKYSTTFKSTSIPTRSHKARGPMGILAPSFMASSIASTDATPSSRA
jgi:acyl CoA:acetate/3-ketoacid CoA transferase